MKTATWLTLLRADANVTATATASTFARALATARRLCSQVIPRLAPGVEPTISTNNPLVRPILSKDFWEKPEVRKLLTAIQTHKQQFRDFWGTDGPCCMGRAAAKWAPILLHGLVSIFAYTLALLTMYFKFI